MAGLVVCPRLQPRLLLNPPHPVFLDSSAVAAATPSPLCSISLQLLVLRPAPSRCFEFAARSPPPGGHLLQSRNSSLPDVNPTFLGRFTLPWSALWTSAPPLERGSASKLLPRPGSFPSPPDPNFWGCGSAPYQLSGLWLSPQICFLGYGFVPLPPLWLLLSPPGARPPGGEGPAPPGLATSLRVCLRPFQPRFLSRPASRAEAPPFQVSPSFWILAPPPTPGLLPCSSRGGASAPTAGAF